MGHSNPVRPLVRFGLPILILLPCLMHDATAADWMRFRGPNGSGIAPDDKPVPIEWSEDKDLLWKTPLPGAGYSSPITAGERVFVTCWSGSADGAREDGALRRHLLCLDRVTGQVLWEKTVPAKLPEDRSQHGYATHTPVTDGKNVYVFFGKSGVFAFDLEGKQLWQADVGSDLDRRGWGSASSPILQGKLLIVTASVESRAMYAFDTATGMQVWKAAADGFESTWGTPIISAAGGRADVVVSVPGELWAFNPESGKLRWYSEGLRSESACNSVIEEGGTIYALGDRGGGSLAVRAGGREDVSKSHIAWTGPNGPRIPTPILWQGRLYWVSGSLANCRDAATGKDIYEERIPEVAAGRGAPATGGADPGPGQRGGGGERERGGFGGRGGRGGNDYASPVAAQGHLFQVTGRGETLVIRLGSTFELVARNRFASDTSSFCATPAISDGQIFIRSNEFLYCVGKKD